MKVKLRSTYGAVPAVAARSPTRLLASRHFVRSPTFPFAPRPIHALFSPRGTNWNDGLGPNRATVG